MRQLTRITLVTLLLLTGLPAAADCDAPQTSEDIVDCVKKDLIAADENINISYKSLKSKLSVDAALNLRQSQRDWITRRDTVCNLDTKAENREDWYQALLQDYAKAVCVTRATRQRNQELEQQLAQLTAPQPAAATPPAAPANSADMSIVFDKTPPTSHANGKWYFEVAVNYAEIVKIEPVLLTIGVLENKQVDGVLANIRMRDKDKAPLIYGFAVDLDNGKLYTSYNGAWANGVPGSNLGKDLKLGRNYNAAIIASADTLEPYLQQKAILPNFGTAAMTYSLPGGYSPWQNAP